MKATIIKVRGELRAEAVLSKVVYEIMWYGEPLKEGQSVYGKIVEHSNQDRIHQMYFEVSHITTTTPPQVGNTQWTPEQIRATLDLIPKHLLDEYLSGGGNTTQGEEGSGSSYKEGFDHNSPKQMKTERVRDHKGGFHDVHVFPDDFFPPLPAPTTQSEGEEKSKLPKCTCNAGMDYEKELQALRLSNSQLDFELKYLRDLKAMIPEGIYDNTKKRYDLQTDIKILIKYIDSLDFGPDEGEVFLICEKYKS